MLSSNSRATDSEHCPFPVCKQPCKLDLRIPVPGQSCHPCRSGHTDERQKESPLPMCPLCCDVTHCVLILPLNICPILISNYSSLSDCNSAGASNRFIFSANYRIKRQAEAQPCRQRQRNLKHYRQEQKELAVKGGLLLGIRTCTKTDRQTD